MNLSRICLNKNFVPPPTRPSFQGSTVGLLLMTGIRRGLRSRASHLGPVGSPNPESAGSGIRRNRIQTRMLPDAGYGKNKTRSGYGPGSAGGLPGKIRIWIRSPPDPDPVAAEPRRSSQVSPSTPSSSSPRRRGASTDLDGLRPRKRRTVVSGEPLYALLPSPPHLVSPRPSPAVEEVPKDGPAETTGHGAATVDRRSCPILLTNKRSLPSNGIDDRSHSNLVSTPSSPEPLDSRA